MAVRHDGEEAAGDDAERRRAREALLAEREHAARARMRRRVGLRSPSSLPAAPSRPQP